MYNACISTSSYPIPLKPDSYTLLCVVYVMYYFRSLDQDGMPGLRGGEDWNRSSSGLTQVPTSDRGQPSPILWVPNPHYLSPT